MTSPRHYVLTMPVAPGQYVTVWSSGPMTLEHFARLDVYLALQKEITAEGEGTAQGIVTEGGDAVAAPVSEAN